MGGSGAALLVTLGYNAKSAIWKTSTLLDWKNKKMAIRKKIFSS